MTKLSFEQQVNEVPAYSRIPSIIKGCASYSLAFVAGMETGGQIMGGLVPLPVEVAAGTIGGVVIAMITRE